jgi:hypothetical protein
MPEGKMTEDKMPVSEMTINKMTVDKMPASEMTINKMTRQNVSG